MNKYFKRIELEEMCMKHIKDTADDIQMFRVFEDETNASCSFAYMMFWMELHKIIMKDLCDYISGPRLRTYRDAAADTARQRVSEKYHGYVNLGRTMCECALENCK